MVKDEREATRALSALFHQGICKTAMGTNLGGAGCGTLTAGVAAAARQGARRMRAKRMRQLLGEDCLMMTTVMLILSIPPRTVPNEGANGSGLKVEVGFGGPNEGG